METTDTEDSKWADSLLASAPAEEPPTETPEAEPETADAPVAEDEPDAASDDDAAPAQEQEQPRFKVKVDGQEVEVTLEELQRGYAGQGYIQKGMKEAADLRKAAEAELTALKTEQARVLQFAQAIQQTGILSAPVPPPAELATKNPTQYVQAFAVYQQKQAAYQDQQMQIGSLQAQQAALQEAEAVQNLTRGAEELKSRIPDFADPQKAKAIKEEVIKAGQEYGYSAEDLLNVTDARAVQVLYDAAQWRKLQSQKPAAMKPVAKNVVPSAKRAEPPQLAQAKIVEKAKKSGRIEDWAETLVVRK